MGTPTVRLSVDEVMRQLSTERQLRFASEQTVKDLRRDNARLASVSKTRTHYVVLVPRPKWGVLRDSAVACARQATLWLRNCWGVLKETIWPPVHED